MCDSESRPRQKPSLESEGLRGQEEKMKKYIFAVQDILEGTVAQLSFSAHRGRQNGKLPEVQEPSDFPGNNLSAAQIIL